MDEVQRKRISHLAGLAHDAQSKFNMLGIKPMSQDPVQQRTDRQRYELARAEVIEANHNLNLAMQPQIKENDNASS